MVFQCETGPVGSGLLGWTGVKQEQLASCTVCLAERTTDSLSYQVTDSPAAAFSQPHILLQTTTLSGHRHTLDMIRGVRTINCV